ncbi:hypothetical protein [Agromyces aerolatus]|uniref:hypothetical protein n=1 Tax=Agromyces sp. LY-1074 TaxID=3074080 RepID=UPI00285ACD91|nr:MULTISPECIES: hypothetical protein [unclassified Agromyces]MDR5699052.1 hypothetical protein [Agromyces sp. LY-1074]MDR5705170.1 hypothetical protein [Agromyces sp. LY-1358]
MRISPKRVVRALTRRSVALATASLVALLALSLAVAPTAPVEALAIAGQSWIPGEVQHESADRDAPAASAGAVDADDAGDDAADAHSWLVWRLVALRAGAAQARSRGIRSAFGADPRGPPAV